QKLGYADRFAFIDDAPTAVGLVTGLGCDHGRPASGRVAGSGEGAGGVFGGKSPAFVAFRRTSGNRRTKVTDHRRPANAAQLSPRHIRRDLVKLAGSQVSTLRANKIIS